MTVAHSDEPAAMRILVHDYSGHPFQVELSRALAERGHTVLHVHCASYRTGKGAVEPRDGDPVSLTLRAIDLGQVFDRYHALSRFKQELAYGKALAEVAAGFRPDVVLSSNDPLFAKARAAVWCWRTGTPWVFWVQDLYSVAMARYATERLGPAGAVLGVGFKVIERRLLQQARAVVMITDDFRPTLRSWSIDEDRCHVIENWAPLDELHPLPKDNPWAREHGLADATVLLYSGTLGLKHDVEPLIALAERYSHDPDLRVVVVSEGSGAERLELERRQRGLRNLVVLPYQPFDRLSEVFATADVLIVLLSRDAGTFSVPSKILSYLCSERPILAALPPENLGARTIRRADAGIAVESGNTEAFLAGADALLASPALRRQRGSNGRAYAERTFRIGPITDRFEAILHGAIAGHRTTAAPLEAGAGR